MKLSDFQKKFKHHVNYGLSYVGISYMLQNCDFDFDVFLPSKGVNLQRGLIWTLEQKQALIFTILRNNSITPITVIETKSIKRDFIGNNNWQVIDGKQRLTTIISFFNNEFPIIWENKDFFYDDLPQDCKNHINFFDGIRVNVHYSYEDNPISDGVKIEIFEQVNWLGTPQDIEHLKSLKS